MSTWYKIRQQLNKVNWCKDHFKMKKTLRYNRTPSLIEHDKTISAKQQALIKVLIHRITFWCYLASLPSHSSLCLYLIVKGKENDTKRWPYRPMFFAAEAYNCSSPFKEIFQAKPFNKYGTSTYLAFDVPLRQLLCRISSPQQQKSKHFSF